MKALFPIIAIVAAGLIFFFYINPTYTGPVATAQAAIASDNQALSAASAYSAKESQLATLRDQIPEDELDRLTAFLPDSVNNVQSILDLNALAARSGLAISSIQVAQDTTDTSSASASAGLPAAQDPVGSVDVALSASGTYAALRAFLAGVESSERLLDVADLSVHGSATGVYTYQITLRLYWLQ